MSTNDLSPMYRTLVGFDRISSLLDQARRLDAAPGYPPFNVEQVSDDAFRIEVAVAGFSDADLDIEFKQNVLTVSGRKPQTEDARKFLHRGIAERDFERRFGLADHVRVESARLENGLLTIELIRELPEAMKPRKIDIAKGAARPKPKAVETDAA